MKFTREMFYGIQFTERNSATAMAQDAFDRWLSEQPFSYSNGLKHTWSTVKYPGHTHQARCVCVEEIAPKECEHEEVQVRNSGGYTCISCFKKVEPTGWREV